MTSALAALLIGRNLKNLFQTIQVETNVSPNERFQNQGVSVKTEPEVAMPNTPNSKSTSKKRKLSKSKSKTSLVTSSEASENSTDSANSSAILSLDDSLNHNVGQYQLQCDLCEEVIKLNTVPAVQPFICEPCQKTYNAASSSCLCKGVMNSVIKTMISCEICQSWYHESCVGVSEQSLLRYID